eukprot:5182762-Lingulodinium_polyedra.AAC.1
MRSGDFRDFDLAVQSDTVGFPVSGWARILRRWCNRDMAADISGALSGSRGSGAGFGLIED